MKKVIRLTESDLVKIVKKVLNEDASIDGVNILVDGTSFINIAGNKYSVSVESPVYSGPVKIKEFTGPHSGWLGDYFTIKTSENQTKDFSKEDISSLVNQAKKGSSLIKISGVLGDVIFNKV